MDSYFFVCVGPVVAIETVARSLIRNHLAPEQNDCKNGPVEFSVLEDAGAESMKATQRRAEKQGRGPGQRPPRDTHSTHWVAVPGNTAGLARLHAHTHHAAC